MEKKKTLLKDFFLFLNGSYSLMIPIVSVYTSVLNQVSMWGWSPTSKAFKDQSTLKSRPFHCDPPEVSQLLFYFPVKSNTNNFIIKIK